MCATISVDGCNASFTALCSRSPHSTPLDTPVTGWLDTLSLASSSLRALFEGRYGMMSRKCVLRVMASLLFIVLALAQGAPSYGRVGDDGATAHSTGSVRVPEPDPKMHHPQLPDLSSMGMDVDMSVVPLADDFLCTETGAVSQMTIWGSFLDDILPRAGPDSLVFELAIRADIPAGVVESWSMPGEMLWRRVFSPGDYVVWPITDGVPEGWFDPLQGYWLPENHTGVFQYDFFIAEDPFSQEEGIIYWLEVKDLRPPEPDYTFGWKTTEIELRWQDDAAYEIDPPLWLPLQYPERHAFERETLDLAFVISGGLFELEFGDAPEGPGVIAYPSTGVMGAFPTCWSVGPAGWIEHSNFGAFFGPSFDLEVDGNAGWCPPPGCFPPYDQDECFADGDAGLLIPHAFTIDPTGAVLPCPGSGGLPLGTACQVAVWRVDVDIDVHNHMPNQMTGYVNVLMDWNQDGRWSGSSICPGRPSVLAPEHVLIDFPVPNGFDGPLSALLPPSFIIGPNPGFVWTRFSITERPVGRDWDGAGSFEDGETEDYLLLVDPTPTATATATLTATPTQTATRPPTATASPTATSTATRPPTQTVTPTLTRSPTPTATSTVTRLPSPTRSATPTTTATRPLTPTATPTATRPPTLTATATVTRLPSATPSATPTGTATWVPTLTATPTLTRPPTPTATPTATRPPTLTTTPTRAPTATGTPRVTPTATATREGPPRYRLYLPVVLRRARLG